MSRRRSRTELAYSPVPFGLGETKPHHFRDMARIVWTNRDNLGYAWRILSQGVCDGCALGTSGLSDWTIDGTHLCMVRLELLRLNTMGALDHAAGRRRRARGLVRRSCATWAASPTRCAAARREGLHARHVGRAVGRCRRALARIRPGADVPLPDQPRHHQRGLLRRPEGDALPGLAQRRQLGAPVPLALHRRPQGDARRCRHDLLLPRLVRSGPDCLLRLEPGQRPAGRAQVPGRGAASAARAW